MTNFKFSGLAATAALFLLPTSLAEAQAPGGAAPPPPAVTVETIEEKPLPITYEYAGRVVASREVEVRARVPGILLQRTFEEGTRVQPDQVLFRIDPREFEAQVALAQAQLAQSQATLSQARRTEERQQTLTQRGAASAATFDDATSSRELAEAQVEAAQATLETARLSLTYATVNAPVGGITSLEQVPEGSLVAVNTLLTKISQLDPIYVNFSAADTEAAAIRRLVEGGAASGNRNDLVVEVSFGDGTVYPEKGTIDFTSSSIDTETGTILSRAVLGNPANRLLPGQFVRVRVSGLTLENAVSIPTMALMQGPQGPFVYTVNAENVAEVRPIRTGTEMGDRTVISEGLKAGDKIVSVGVVKVRPNAPVAPSAPEAVAADGPSVPQKAATPAGSSEAAPAGNAAGAQAGAAAASASQSPNSSTAKEGAQ
ncbi:MULTISPECIES: efflux RND transporter periplasmic adaptor subunit [unclassified Aureimonas]|uniref:efflux RND transporter periplasmic adaptor subunit n=1 Tax=unclassified Aureimonas TaxID=2615206 RepID=UPI0009E84CEB|nr:MULTISPECIES: efflux RND transporter periplasmic adaptor subunit [unclassified Aureimonas]